MSIFTTFIVFLAEMLLTLYPYTWVKEEKNIHKMRLILILSVLNSVQAQIQLSPTRQNLSLPGLEIEHNAKSGFYFQRTSTL